MIHNLEIDIFKILVEIFDNHFKIFTTDQFISLLVLFLNKVNSHRDIILDKLQTILDLWSEIDFVLEPRLLELLLELDQHGLFSLSKSVLDHSCSRCHTKFKKHILLENDRKLLENQLIDSYEKEKINRQSKKEDHKISKIKNNLNDFRLWLSQNLKNTLSRLVIIDGGNVGHSNKGIFSKVPIISLLNLIIKKSVSEIIPGHDIDSPVIFLIILHHSRKKEFESSNDELKLLNLNLLVYYTPYEENDDYYWMMASFMTPNSLVITNDNLRDHHVGKLDEKLFHYWKDNHLVTYYYQNITRKFILNFPTEYTIGVQSSSSSTFSSASSSVDFDPRKTYHLPVYGINEWWCLRFNKK
jgi:hypothetical protein